MSESPVRPTSTQLPSPKSSSEKYGSEKRLSLNEVVNESIDPKSSPSNQNFLSSLKTFSIEKSKYRHYGTSMNSHALQSIINESDNHMNSESMKPESTKPENIHSDKINSDNIKTNKFIIDEYISEILSLPKQTIAEGSVWPYNIATLNEILKYKVEQEKTKQELIKTEFSNTSLEILKLVNIMNIDKNLLPIIFNSSEDSLKILQLKLKELHHFNNVHNHATNNSHHEDNKSYTFKKEPSIDLTKSNTTELNQLKRKHSDTHLPSFSQTTESIKSNIESPITQSPHEEHRRNKSTSSASSKGSRHSPIHHHIQLPTPQSKISRASPPIQPQLPPNVYQIYYGPPINESGSNGQSSNPLGSPYSAKYPGLIYQPPPPGYVVPQYQYFVPSTPNNEMNANNQTPFAIRPPNMLPLPHPTPQPPVPSHQFQSNDRDSNKSNIFRSAEIHEDNITTTKRQKSIGKSTSINFMITTPKNPPARKYNNPSKDK